MAQSAYKCETCGKPVARPRIKKCRECYLISIQKNKRYCVGCGVELKYGMLRCMSCNRKYYSGERHVSWKSGKPKCIDCGQEISYRTKRCRICYLRLLGGKIEWNEEEIKMLRQLYPLMPASEVATRIGRKLNAVRRRAFILGIKADRRTHYRDNWQFLVRNPYCEIAVQERAYIAGVFDGEGHICVTNRMFWELGITNTNAELLQWLESKVKYSSVSWQNRKQYKPIGNWRIFGNLKIRAFLNILLPYLIVKRDKAIKALESITEKDKDIIDLQTGNN